MSFYAAPFHMPSLHIPGFSLCVANKAVKKSIENFLALERISEISDHLKYAVFMINGSVTSFTIISIKLQC